MGIIGKARQLKELIRGIAQEISDKTLLIAVSNYFDQWTPGCYKVGDVRTDEDGKPYECFAEHDSTSNPSWDISVRTLWKPYHSRKKEYALPFEKPTGAHDMYLAGEYMIFDDGKTYLCTINTAYSPVEYGPAWEAID